MSELVNQPTAMPTRKVQNGALYGLVSFVLLQIARHFWGDALPAEIQDSLPMLTDATVLLVTVAGAYFTKERAGRQA